MWLLLQAGVNPLLAAKDGRTSIHMAACAIDIVDDMYYTRDTHSHNQNSNNNRTTQSLDEKHENDTSGSSINNGDEEKGRLQDETSNDNASQITGATKSQITNGQYSAVNSSNSGNSSSNSSVVTCNSSDSMVATPIAPGTATLLLLLSWVHTRGSLQPLTSTHTIPTTPSKDTPKKTQRRQSSSTTSSDNNAPTSSLSRHNHYSQSGLMKAGRRLVLHDSACVPSLVLGPYGVETTSHPSSPSIPRSSISPQIPTLEFSIPTFSKSLLDISDAHGKPPIYWSNAYTRNRTAAWLIREGAQAIV